MDADRIRAIFRDLDRELIRSREHGTYPARYGHLEGAVLIALMEASTELEEGYESRKRQAPPFDPSRPPLAKEQF